MSYVRELHLYGKKFFDVADVVFCFLTPGCFKSAKANHENGIAREHNLDLWLMLDAEFEYLCSELFQSFSELWRCHIHHLNRSGHVQLNRQPVYLCFREPEVPK